MRTLAAFYISTTAVLLFYLPSNATEVLVAASYAACKDPATVEKFEAFERDDDDQGYKRLYLETGASGECIFLRHNEIVEAGETRGRWRCVRELSGGPCYWTDRSVVEPF